MNNIEDYLLIGNLYSAALVSKNGSIDWMCLPYFDSPALFAKILDETKGGSISIEALDYEAKAEYKKDTAIAITTFQSKEHSFATADFMPILPERNSKHLYLVRNFHGLRGSENISVKIEARPNYGKDSLTFQKERARVTAYLNGDTVIIHLPEKASIEIDKECLKIDMLISKNVDQAIIVEYIVNGRDSNFKYSDWPKMLDFTDSFWRDWVNRHHYVDIARDLMVRSAITLKLMQFQPTGAIIAAPTTSLPEVIGGSRNWDYRYVWIRDAAFTLYSLMILGCRSEASAFFEFLEQSVGWESKPQIELMYTIYGKRVPEEKELSHLQGYEGSSPVRIGNDASNQFQLDVFGTLIDAIYFAVEKGVEMTPGMRRLVLRLANDIDTLWNTKDQGIWEMRDVPRHFTHSKVVCWVGINRTIRMAEALELSSDDKEKFTKLEKQIKDWIYSNCLGPEGQVAQHPETAHQDATNFLFVLLQFFDRDDLQTKQLLRKTCQELLHDEVFVYRYTTDDGLPGDEGAFTLATYWLISALAITGETDKALDIFRKFEKHINESGLLSEEMNIKTGQYLGNFPQGFSHMGLIMAAHYIDKYSKKKLA